MSKEHTQRKNKFFAEDAHARFENQGESDKIARINVKLAETESELRLYPRIVQEVPVTKDGVQVGSKTEENLPEWEQLPKWTRELIKQGSDMESDRYVVIEGTARVNEYDDGGVMFQMFDNMMKADSFDVYTEKNDEIIGNPVKVEGETDENQSTLDEMNGDESDDETDENVLFGEDSED